MMSPLLLWRLAWRPMTLLQLFLVLLAALMPLLMSDLSPDDVWHAIERDAVTRDMRVALWQTVVMLSAAFGFMLASYRLELQHTTIAWALPGVRRSMTLGLATAAALAGVVSTLIMTRIEGSGAAAPASALAFAAFVMPNILFDGALSRMLRLLTACALLAIALRGDALVQVFDAQPIPAALTLLALGAIMLRAVESAELARVRPFRWSNFTGMSGRRLYWSAHKLPTRTFDGTLATTQLWPWLRAALHESSAFLRRAVLGSTIVCVLAGRLMEDAGPVTVLSGMFLLSQGVQLGRGLLYPLSRARRALLAYAGSLLTALLYFATLSAVLAVSYLLPLPVLPFADDVDPVSEWLLKLGLAFALAPVAQWAHVRRGSSREWAGATPFAMIGWLLVYALPVAALSTMLPARIGTSPGRLTMVVVVTAVIAQAIHALLLHRYFRTADLTPFRR